MFSFLIKATLVYGDTIIKKSLVWYRKGSQIISHANHPIISQPNQLATS